MINIYTDGACRRNPGPAAIGIVIVDSSENILEKYGECIGEATNNRAEYCAIIKALELVAKYGDKKICITSDSEVVINQLQGNYKIRNETLRELFSKVRSLEKSYDATYVHKSRTNKYIQIADELCNAALGQM